MTAAPMAYEPHLAGDAVTVYVGDCLQVLRSDDFGYDWSLGYRPGRLIPDASVDAVITDPPYGIGFMGKQWDCGKSFVERKAARRNTSDHVGGNHNPSGAADAARTRRVEAQRFGAWCGVWASECLRVLKPGGHLLAFGGARTWHRLASAVEDAGFEVRDSIAWLYGGGFPKSVDVSKAIDKAAGVERPVVGSVAARMPQAQATGWGNPGVDNFRDAHKGTHDMPVTAPVTESAARWQGWGTALKPAFEPIVVARKPLAGTVAANVLEHGTGALNIDACRVHSAGSEPKNYTVKRWAPGASVNKTGHWKQADVAYTGLTAAGRWPTNVVLDDALAAELDAQSGVLKSGANPARRGSDKFRNTYGAFTGQTECVAHRGADEGGASRFFPVFRYAAKAPSGQRPAVDGLTHPTVKPLDLMRWLVRLVTPPHGVVLDPFAGSGTTAEAAIHEHRRAIVIERDHDYVPLIVARLRKPMEIGFDFDFGEPA